MFPVWFFVLEIFAQKTMINMGWVKGGKRDPRLFVFTLETTL